MQIQAPQGRLQNPSIHRSLAECHAELEVNMRKRYLYDQFTGCSRIGVGIHILYIN